MIDVQIERGYVTASVAAEIVGVTRQRINQLLKANRFDGAFLMDCGDGREMWVIPRNQLQQRKKKHHAANT